MPKPGEELMEIRIRDATVTYVLNKEQICVTGYLFLDNLSDLEGYLNACNKHFKIAGLGYWKYKVHYIELKKEEEFDSFLHFR